jgi:hypothetical protein
MKISSIGNISYEPYKPLEISKEDAISINKKISDKLTLANKNENWYNRTIEIALDKLENSIHLDNSNPLDRPENQPIESYEEALIVLSFTSTPFFKNQAAGAQANIDPRDVLTLFTEN